MLSTKRIKKRLFKKKRICSFAKVRNKHRKQCFVVYKIDIICDRIFFAYKVLFLINSFFFLETPTFFLWKKGTYHCVPGGEEWLCCRTALARRRALAGRCYFFFFV
jgi:hypothetical protein